jgi:hypothetical protein
VKRTCYAQASQIRQVRVLEISHVYKEAWNSLSLPAVLLHWYHLCLQIRRKMTEIMSNQASCDLKELVSKFIPEDPEGAKIWHWKTNGGNYLKQSFCVTVV